MATITFTTKVGGVLANVTSVVLADPAETPTYGLRRADTGEVILAAGTPMVNTATGVYAVDFYAVDGISYEGYVTWTYGTETHHYEVLYTEPVPSVTSTISLANAVQERFRAQVASLQALLTVYDNDPTPAPTQAAVWCRFSVRDGASQRIAIGTSEYRTVGVAIAQLFGRPGEGTLALRQVADAIISAFRGCAADGIRYGAPYVENVGDQQGHYQMNVYCPFQVDTIDS